MKDLLVGLRERGLDTTRPILCVLDGAQALVAAVKAVFDQPVVHRCQLHKLRNVESKLPKALASTVGKKMRAAYHDPDALTAEATLEALARSLDKKHPGAAGSCGRGSWTPSPSAGWACHQRSPARCAPRMPWSR